MAVRSYKKNEQTLWIAMAKIRDESGKQVTRRQSGIATQEQALKAESKLKAELWTSPKFNYTFFMRLIG